MQFVNVLEQLFYRENAEVGLRNPGEVAVGVDKMNEPLGAFVYGFQRFAYFSQVLFLFFRQLFNFCSVNQILYQVPYGGAQGGNGGDGIHDFVGEYANELLPRLHLLFVEFVLNVLDGNQHDVAVVNLELGTVNRQLQQIVFFADLHQRILTVAYGQQFLNQIAADVFELSDVVQVAQLEKALGGVVGHFNMAIAPIGNQRNADVLNNGLQVVVALFFLSPDRFKVVNHFVEGDLKLVERRVVAFNLKGSGEIGIANGLQKTVQQKVGLIDLPKEQVRLQNGQNGYQEECESQGRLHRQKHEQSQCETQHKDAQQQLQTKAVKAHVFQVFGRGKYG